MEITRRKKKQNKNKNKRKARCLHVINYSNKEGVRVVNTGTPLTDPLYEASYQVESISILAANCKKKKEQYNTEKEGREEG